MITLSGEVFIQAARVKCEDTFSIHIEEGGGDPT
jgi:hypothetical protein